MVMNYGGQIQQGLMGLGNQLMGATQMREQREAQEGQQAALQQAAQLYQTGSPEEIAAFSIANPQIGQVLGQQIAFRNDATRQNMLSSMRDILVDPSRAGEIIQSRAEMVQAQGGDPSQTLGELERYQTDPDSYVKSVERSYAMMDPQGYKAYKESIPGAGPKPTANIQDFQYYEELKKSSPEAAEQFARQVGITEKPTSEVRPTTAMQNFDKWDSMPEGPTKDAFAQQIGIKPKANPKEERLKAEEIDLLQGKVQSASDTVTTIDEILGDPALGDMVGLPSAFPTVPGSDVANLEAKVEQFRNQLTLENLDKMSGVLTDRDIQVLASAASGLETSMSPGAFRSQLNKIKSTLNRGIRQNRAKLKSKGLEVETEDTQEQDAQGQSITEGTVIRNPQTGETLILKGGQWVANNG